MCISFPSITDCRLVTCTRIPYQLSISKVDCSKVLYLSRRDGGTAEVVMAQLCATLEEWSPAKTGARVGSAYDAMLLALRGVSLAGGGIGAEDATRFRRVKTVVGFFDQVSAP